MTKDGQRKEIERLTEEYLAKGGKVEVLPTYHIAPAHMEWIVKAGMDYVPWGRHGHVDFIEHAERLDEGCYLTKPADTGA